MAKIAPTSIKYIIRALFKADGVVEKPDIIGAVFGQTEGLMGPELDLRELQKTGRLGRIDVVVKTEKGKTEGEIIIPSALDASETALIAAAIETIDRIGPCTAEIRIESIEDVRATKREYVISRAKEIMERFKTAAPDISKLSEEIKESARAGEISSYYGLPCGPDIPETEEIIVVEGRADVINLLRYGIKNAIAIEGTSVPEAIVQLAKEKKVTLFIDGDRGGELIAKEFEQTAKVDFVAVAPAGKEVEELTQKEVLKALRDKIPAEKFFKKVKPEQKIAQKAYIKDAEFYKKILEELVGTRAACIYDEKLRLLGRVPIKELEGNLKTIEKPYLVIMDGKIDFRTALAARRAGVKIIVGTDKEQIGLPIKIITKQELG
ncbi:MAG: DNA primase DnaG [Candidatus Aenigmatarchaeota archaeon]